MPTWMSMYLNIFQQQFLSVEIVQIRVIDDLHESLSFSCQHFFVFITVLQVARVYHGHSFAVSRLIGRQ